MPPLDLPYVSTMTGGTADRRHLRATAKTLRMALPLLAASPTMPTHGMIVGVVDHGGLLSFLEEDGNHLTATFSMTGRNRVVLRTPRMEGDDLAEIAVRLCRIAIASIEGALKPHGQEFLDRVLLRSDAVCAMAAQAARVEHHEIKLRPATPFSRPRITIVDLQRGEMMQWSLEEEHDFWIDALHVHFTAYDMPDGSVHMIFDTLIHHTGTRDADTIRMMRMLADLPPGPPLIVPDVREPMF